jgi:hypothetical protein
MAGDGVYGQRGRVLGEGASSRGESSVWCAVPRGLMGDPPSGIRPRLRRRNRKCPGSPVAAPEDSYRCTPQPTERKMHPAPRSLQHAPHAARRSAHRTTCRTAHRTQHTKPRATCSQEVSGLLCSMRHLHPHACARPPAVETTHARSSTPPPLPVNPSSQPLRRHDPPALPP